MSEIKEFYYDKTVLLTGGTGFLGKMTVEKLLRSCDTKKIYLLFRCKKEETTKQRLEKYFDSPMFANLAKQRPDFKHTIEVLEGDVQRPNLGLKERDVQKIVREVEVIFHWAENVSFVENLKVATEVNVKAVMDIIVIARKMPQLKSFLYGSTAFSHCIIKEIYETFYDDTLDGKNLIACMDSLNKQAAEDITAGLLGKWPNTYVYTKSAAENIIKTEGIGLPIGIYRPSIVTAAYKEPTPGWLDSLCGYTGLLLSIGLGYLRVSYANPRSKVNLVPADYVVNSAIAVSWQISRQNRTEIPIFNFTDTNEHSLTVEKISQLSYVSGLKVVSTKVVWHHTMFYAAYGLFFKILDYFLHYIPAHIMDFIYVCSRQKPKFVKIYKKVQKMSEVLLYFTTKEWSFNNKNITSLWNSMCAKDRELFEFDMSALDWNDYMDQYLLGMRLYVFKNPLYTIPTGNRKMLRLKIIHYSVVALFLFVLYYITTWILHIIF